MENLTQSNQNWMKRLTSCGFIAVFIVIIGWIGQAKADWGQEYIPFNPVVDTFQHTREIIFITTLFLMIVSLTLALFKKISWFYSFSLFSCLIFFAMLGLTLDYVLEPPFEPNGSEKTQEWIIILEIALILSPIILLPVLFSIIQYKFRKIDKKLLKRRLLFQAVCVFLVLLFIGTFAFLILSH